MLLQVAVGEMNNLKKVVSCRHPAIYDDQDGTLAGSGQPIKSRTLAISSVHAGEFIGMNDWTRVLVGDLPGRFSTNYCFQQTAKSPIQLLNISQVSQAALMQQCFMLAKASCQFCFIILRPAKDIQQPPLDIGLD